MSDERRRGETDCDWAPCSACDEPVPLDENGNYALHLVWMDRSENYVVECDGSRIPCLDWSPDD